MTTAFDGEGARLYGGRWNSAGRRVVYTSETQALAALEMLVHLQASRLLLAYSVIRVRFTRDLVESVAQSSLPENWRSYPPPAALRVLGDDWIEGEGSPVLRVPSAVVRDEHNFLINPAHPLFSQLEVGEPEPFVFDARLLES